MELNDNPVEHFIAPTDSEFEAQLQLRRGQRRAQQCSVAMTAWLQDHVTAGPIVPEQFTKGRFFAIPAARWRDKDTLYGPSNRFPNSAGQEALGSVSSVVANTCNALLDQPLIAPKISTKAD
jgi:hypothetical protein